MLQTFKVDDAQKMQHIWPYGVPGALLLHAIHFHKDPSELILSSN